MLSSAPRPAEVLAFIERSVSHLIVEAARARISRRSENRKLSAGLSFQDFRSFRPNRGTQRRQRAQAFHTTQADAKPQGDGRSSTGEPASPIDNLQR